MPELSHRPESALGAEQQPYPADRARRHASGQYHPKDYVAPDQLPEEE
jgi:hypothetical protein